MGSQYKVLKQNDIEFIQKQKLFFIASCSNKEVNISPKGYDSIKVLDESTIVFMNYPGSGNRTYTDATNDGEFTLIFTSYEGEAKILRVFCKASIVKYDSDDFNEYLELFDEKKEIVRDFFKFDIYAVESSCGESIPIMEYKKDRRVLKDWAIKMDKNKKLEKYKKDHLIPPNLDNL